jgi:hypothetical protein
VLGFVLLIELFYLAGTLVVLPQSDYMAAVISSVLVDETNEVRKENGNLATLRINPVLVRAAQIKADDMASRGYFAHVTPDGKEPWYFLGQVGYEFSAAGENLAVNYTESSDVTRAWMNSPGHRANVLNGKYSEIGVATSQGTYKGQPAIFVVQFFGKPKNVSALADLSLLSVAEAKAVASTSENIASITKLVATTTLQTQTVSSKATSTSSSTSTKLPSTSVSTTSAAQLQRPTVKSAATEIIEQPEAVSRPSVLARILTSTRELTTLVYLGIGAMVFIAVLILLFFRYHKAHPHLVLNGVLLLAFIALCILANTALVGMLGRI